MKILKIPLSPLSLSPNPENMEEMEKNVLFAALKLSALGLDHIIITDITNFFDIFNSFLIIIKSDDH
jgi:hypothetical protein